MRSAGLLALAACALGACGGGSGAPADGGPSVRRAYDVTITIGTITRDPQQSGGWDEFPKTFTATLTWDEASGEAFAGGGGAFSKLSVLPLGGGRYGSSGPLAAAVPFPSSCDGVGSLGVGDFELTLDEGGALHGSGHGRISYQLGDTPLQVAAEVSLAGTPDVTPPSFAFPEGELDPLAPLWFVASEPLPPDAAASLVGMTSGDVVPLSAAPVDLLRGAVRQMGLPATALRPGETYRLTLDGLADFLGHAPAPVTVKTRAAPPLVPEDGFESVDASAFAGAGVLQGGPLTPIAGQTSLMLNTGFGGGFGFLPYDLGPSLAVRLAVAPGDTVVRFDGQLIAPDAVVDTAAFDGAVRVGSAGGTVGTTMGVAGDGFTRATLPGLGDVYINPVKTFEYPLPEGSTGEVTFEIVGVTFKCGIPPSPTVLVIDNLRLE